MYKLTAICTPTKAEEVTIQLRANDGVSQVLHASSQDGEITTVVVTALVRRNAIDTVLADMRSVQTWEAGELFFIEVDFAVHRTIEQEEPGQDDDEDEDIIGWEIIQDLARAESRQTWWYLVFMACAGLIAALGFIADLPVLIVGAMSLSPDLAPSNAIAIALLTGDFRSARKSLVTLVVGLAVAGVAALLITIFLDWTRYLPDPLVVDEALKTFVTVVDAVTVIVALTAGVAAMTAFVTKQATTAVGVAISVTTIPAAAYAGVAIADQATTDGMAAILVLGVNIICLTLAQNLTLLVIRRWRMRRRHQSAASSS